MSNEGPYQLAEYQLTDFNSGGEQEQDVTHSYRDEKQNNSNLKNSVRKN
jgi:hypothetical protein